MDSELHFGQPEIALVAFDRNPIVARQRQLEPTAQRKSVDRGDGRNTELLEASEYRLATRRKLGTDSRAVNPSEFLHVGA